MNFPPFAWRFDMKGLFVADIQIYMFQAEKDGPIAEDIVEGKKQLLDENAVFEKLG